MVASWQLTRRKRVGTLRHAGTVLQWKWKQQFGWIQPDRTVHHPEASKNDWRIYVNAQDVEGGVQLHAGARVSFFAYSDGKGLGAEEVWLEEEGGGEVGKSIGQRGKGTNRSTLGRNLGRRPGQIGVQRTISKPVRESSTVSPPSPGKGCGKAAKSGKAKGKGGGGGKTVVLRPGPGGGPDREKTTSQGAAHALSWAVSEMRGWRPAMEDASCALLDLAPPLASYALFGVFDGHGGSTVSRWASEELPAYILEAAAGCSTEEMDEPTAMASTALSQALPALDDAIRSGGEGSPGFLPASGGAPIESSVRNAYGLMGSTAVVALVECDGQPEAANPIRIVVANLGDSRAIVCRAGEAIEMTEDHKPENPSERERIEKAGGFVAPVGPCQRIDGWGLNLSRALGDFHYKGRDDLPPGEQKVSVEPELCMLDVTAEDEFLFLGCDGVFEIHSSQDVVDSVRAGLQEGKSLQQVVEDLVDASCSEDLATTLGKGGDNVSAMVVLLQPNCEE